MNEWQELESRDGGLNGRVWVFTAPGPPIAAWSILAAHRVDCDAKRAALGSYEFPVFRLHVVVSVNAYGNRFWGNEPQRRPSARLLRRDSRHQFPIVNTVFAPAPDRSSNGFSNRTAQPTVSP